MLKKFARTVTVFAFAAALQTWSEAARADGGGASDAAADAGRVDIKSISHEDADGVVTYRLETHDAFDNERDFYLATWKFDFNGDGIPADGCALLEQAGDGKLRASYKSNCDAEISWTADASKAESNVLEFDLPVAELVRSGLSQDGAYTYVVTTQDLDGVSDSAPDGSVVTHEEVSIPDGIKSAESTMTAATTANGSAATSGAPAGVDPIAAGRDAISPDLQEVGQEGYDRPSDGRAVRGSSNAWWLGLGGVAAIAALVLAVSAAARARRRPIAG